MNNANSTNPKDQAVTHLSLSGNLNGTLPFNKMFHAVILNPLFSINRVGGDWKNFHSLEGGNFQGCDRHGSKGHLGGKEHENFIPAGKILEEITQEKCLSLIVNNGFILN